MIPRDGQFGLRTGLVGPGTQLVLHERTDVVREDLQAIDIGTRRANGFVGGQHGQKRIRGGRRHIELGERRLTLRELGLCACDVNSRFALAEVDGVPRHQHAGGATPDAVAEGARAEHRP